ncbi:hypothetical protein AB0A74_38605 [Saccharothrix sp. NPDC042600]|uniref:hypothetical protein n=1 Tax=Saccharothrix TaxID=2071 RepID=UPI0034009591|nr:hypothetical protein GCM10017745_56710 [Saccharothrix mutabilis subsp. capreolus]
MSRGTMNATEAAQQVEYLTDRAVIELTGLHGASGVRPPHLAHLVALFDVAKRQAWAVVNGSPLVERDAELWRLREPGLLRAVCDVPVAQPGGVPALLPVAITWGLLGVAEAMYLAGDLSADLGERPPFFAYWLSLPLPLSPVSLSVLIVATVAVLMVRYVKPARARRRADRADRVVHRLEADLVEPLATLWAARPVTDQGEQTRRLAVELTSAARRFGGAAERLDAAVATVERLGDAVSRLLDGLPHLGAHVTRLADVEQRIGRGAEVLEVAVRPVTELVDEVGRAVSSAGAAVVRAEDVLARADVVAGQARQVAVVTAEQRAAVGTAEQPFAEAAARVESAARDLGAATGTLHEAGKQLRTAIREANWMAMVVDGLRATNGAPHGADEFPPAAPTAGTPAAEASAREASAAEGPVSGVPVSEVPVGERPA